MGSWWIIDVQKRLMNHSSLQVSYSHSGTTDAWSSCWSPQFVGRTCDVQVKVLGNSKMAATAPQLLWFSSEASRCVLTFWAHLKFQETKFHDMLKDCLPESAANFQISSRFQVESLDCAKCHNLRAGLESLTHRWVPNRQENLTRAALA